MSRKFIEPSRRRHAFADAASIVTTITLVVSLVIAVTTVSIGIARADALAPMAGGSGRLALAVLAAFVVAGVGGLTVAMVRDGKSSARRD